MNYQNVSNPAAFGAEWAAGDNGNRFQLVNSRGTTSLMFGVLHENSTEWISTQVIEPGRFGLDSPPRTWAEFLAIVRRYVEDE